LVPVECFLNDSFYLSLVFKTTMPFVAVAFIWMYPTSLYVAGKEYSLATQTTARISLLFLELVCPSTTSTIIRTFICQRFGQ